MSQAYRCMVSYRCHGSRGTSTASRIDVISTPWPPSRSQPGLFVSPPDAGLDDEAHVARRSPPPLFSTFDVLIARRCLREHQEVARLNDTTADYREVTAPTLLMFGGRSRLDYVPAGIEALSTVLPVSDLDTNSPISITSAPTEPGQGTWPGLSPTTARSN